MNAAGEIDDVEVVIAIEGDGTGLVELASAGAARANDFDRGEKLAADSHRMLRRLSATGDEKQGGGGGRGKDETFEIGSDGVDGKWREGNEQEPDAEGVHLTSMAVMQHVKNAERERFATRRNDEQEGFDLPEAKQVEEICAAEEHPF